MQERRATRQIEQDRRSAARGAVRCEVEFLVGGVLYSAVAENLSETGAFVATEVEVFGGMSADISLVLDDPSETIKLVGKVVRIARRRDERPGFAVEFDSIDGVTRARIRSAIGGADSA